MREREPSRTALAAAAYRAAHQVVDEGRIFLDPLALPILGLDAAGIAERPPADPARRGIRLFIAARSSFAETALAEGVATRGVRQVVVLGAGLDTFGCRDPFDGRLTVFEVDHSATQAWKRRRLEAAGLRAPSSLVFAPVDFESDDLLGRLIHAGFDPKLRTFFAWLGVVPYLTREAISATLAVVGGLAGGAEVVFDYSDPPETLPPDLARRRLERAARVAALGEPFLSAFEPAELHAMLRRAGFEVIDDFGPRRLQERFALNESLSQSGGLDRGGHVIFAGTLHI